MKNIENKWQKEWKMLDIWLLWQAMLVLCFKILKIRTEVYLVEDDDKLVLDEYNSSFITYELEPGDYTFKDIYEALFNILQPEYPEPSNTIVIEFDDITRKTTLVVRSGIVAIRLHQKLFFSTVLGFTPGWG